MRSDIIHIDNSGNGFEDAVNHSKKVASYKELTDQETIQLQMLTEEMLSLALSITGKMDASFWIEMEEGPAELHMTTKAVLDKEKRAELIASATSRQNEVSKTFLGRIRDRFEEAMAADPYHEQLPSDLLADLPGGVGDEADWDGYERSILRKMADEVKIGIQNGTVEITVSKRFSAVK